jgi:hypothetical protein
MNWDAIGAIAEVVGAAAVIITLAYLAIQIRQNTQMNASALRQSFYNYTARQMLHGTDSTEFSELLAKAGTTNETLSPGERLQISRMFHAVFVGYQGAYFQYKQGALGQDDWKTCRALLRSFWLFKGKEWADLWMQFKTGGFLDDDFVAECELLREEAEHYALALEQKDMGFQRG